MRNAMRRIARNRRDAGALIDAGNAALLLDDASAARNFFERAQSLRPGDGRVKAGLGSAYVRLENPFEALRFFDEATKLGVSERVIAADRGMAFDLLGNFDRAQQDYRIASTAVGSNRVTIQHAISLSLSGKSQEADAMLVPLLDRNDPAAWRARAFMLAARGELRESREVTRGFLDARGAQRMERFLRQMPRLTGAQQAAAIHLGHFPANNIGRDSEDVRTLASNIPPSAPPAGSSRLIPAGPPLGSPSNAPGPANSSALRLPTTTERRVAAAASASANLVARQQVRTPPAPVASAALLPVAGNQAEAPKVAQAGDGAPPQAGFDALPGQTTTASATESSTQDIGLPPSGNAPTTNNSAADTAAAPTITGPPVASMAANNSPPESTPPATEEAVSAPDQIATILETQSEQPDSSTPPPSPIGPPASTEVASSSTENDLQDFDLGDVVAAIEIPEEEKRSNVEAVDLSSLPPKESAEETATPEKQAAQTVNENVSTKARYWVQISTGDQSAMRGEYRRLSRKHPELFEGQEGWTSPWNNMARLVVGPFSGYSAAKAWYDALKEAGGDSFVWNSAEGTVVTRLNSK